MVYMVYTYKSIYNGIYYYFFASTFTCRSRWQCRGQDREYGGAHLLPRSSHRICACATLIQIGAMCMRNCLLHTRVRRFRLIFFSQRSKSESALELSSKIPLFMFSLFLYSYTTRKDVPLPFILKTQP
jgi:hypothetical protein